MRRSSELFADAQTILPGGVNSPVRAFKSVGGSPLFIHHALGSRLTDEDGHTYVDLVSSWGAVILGHAHPPIVKAVTDAMAGGSTYGAPTEAETLLAKAIRDRIPSMQRVRLVSSGTEATMHAVRLARGATKRDLIIKMDGCFHGAHDAVLVAAGSGLATLGIPDSLGVPAATAAATLVVPYNNVDAVRVALEANPERVAAVLVEPVAGNMGCIVPEPGYLEGLRALCDAHGTLLIFDEVMTGLRVDRGGAQARFGVTPDLTTLGKVVGGGLPLAAFGGRADLMEQLAPQGSIYQAGTLSGNAACVSAGRAALAGLTPDVYATLEASGAAIEAALAPHLAAEGASMNRVGSMFTVFFRPTPPKDFVEAKQADTARFVRYFRAALDRGVYLPASAFEAAFFAVTLTDEALDETVSGLVDALRISAHA